MNKNPNNLNVSENHKDKGLFLKKHAIESLVNKLQERDYKDRVERNNLILELIRLRQPVSKYEIAKLSGKSYPLIKQVTKEFEFCGLVYIYNSIGENGMPVKLISLKTKGEPSPSTEKGEASDSQAKEDEE